MGNKKPKIMMLGLIALLVGTSIFLYMNVVGYSIYGQEKTNTVKIGYLPILASLPLYVAQENQYFETGGISIEFVQLQSSNQLVDALVRGDIDIVVESSAVPVLIVESIDPNKIKIFSVSDITSQTPFDSIIVQKDSTLESLKDLEGKKIGVFPGSTATNLLKAYLEDSGIDTKNIEFVKIIPPNQLPALYEGSIDALHAYEPTTTIAIESNNAKKLYGSIYAKQLNHNLQGVALISSDFVRENPELAEKVINSFDKASDFMKTNDKETREIITKYVKVNEDVAENTVLLYMGRSDEINEDILQDYADMLFKLGELETKVDVSDLIYRP